VRDLDQAHTNHLVIIRYHDTLVADVGKAVPSPRYDSLHMGGRVCRQFAGESLGRNARGYLVRRGSDAPVYNLIFLSRVLGCGPGHTMGMESTRNYPATN
jgi:hypothetical protein